LNKIENTRTKLFSQLKWAVDYTTHEYLHKEEDKDKKLHSLRRIYNDSAIRSKKHFSFIECDIAKDKWECEPTSQVNFNNLEEFYEQYMDKDSYTNFMFSNNLMVVNKEGETRVTVRGFTDDSRILENFIPKCFHLFAYKRSLELFGVYAFVIHCDTMENCSKGKYQINFIMYLTDSHYLVPYYKEFFANFLYKLTLESLFGEDIKMRFHTGLNTDLKKNILLYYTRINSFKQ
jgi:hypothetical protein